MVFQSWQSVRLRVLAHGFRGEPVGGGDGVPGGYLRDLGGGEGFLGTRGD